LVRILVVEDERKFELLEYLLRVAGDVRHATWTITDGGSGIAVEHRQRIFDRFYRVDEGRSREMGGTGLGLAIAKWAVEVNDGEIAVETAGTGTAFRIVLTRVVG
jgi:signal transduction histidine kinase